MVVVVIVKIGLLQFCHFELLLLLKEVVVEVVEEEHLLLYIQLRAVLELWHFEIIFAVWVDFRIFGMRCCRCCRLLCTPFWMAGVVCSC